MKRAIVLLALAACARPSLSLSAHPSAALSRAQTMLAAPEAEVTIFEGSSERALGEVVYGPQTFDLRDQTETQHVSVTLLPGEYHVRLVYYETRSATGTRMPIELARANIIVFDGKPVTAELDPVAAPDADPEIDLDADDDGVTNLDEILAGTDPETNPILWTVSAGTEGVGRSKVAGGADGIVVIDENVSGEPAGAAAYAWADGAERWHDEQEASYASDGVAVLMRGKASVPTYRAVTVAGAPLWSHAFTGFADAELFDSPYLDANNALVVFGTNGRLVGYRPVDNGETFASLNAPCTAVRKAERQLRYNGPLHWLVNGDCGQGAGLPTRIIRLQQTFPLAVDWHVQASSDASFVVLNDGSLAVCDGDFLRVYSSTGVEAFAHQVQRSGPTTCAVTQLPSGDLAVTTNVEARLVSLSGALKAQLTFVQGATALPAPPIAAPLPSGGVALAVPFSAKPSTTPQRIVALDPNGTSRTLFTIATSATDNASVIYSNVAVLGQTTAFVGFRCLPGATCAQRPPSLIAVKL